MRVKQTCGVLLSGFAVYFAIAACSALSPSDDRPSRMASSGSSGANGGSSTSGASGSPVGNALADDSNKSGARLKMRYLEGEDGSRQFFQWFDTTRNEECSFTLHSDGSWRCMPMTAANAGYWATSSCSGTEVVILAKGSPTPKYAVKYQSGGSQRFAASGHTGPVFTGKPGQCTDITTSFSTTYDLFDVGAEIPASAFVLGTMKTE